MSKITDITRRQDVHDLEPDPWRDTIEDIPFRKVFVGAVIFMIIVAVAIVQQRKADARLIKQFDNGKAATIVVQPGQQIP